MSKKLPVYGIKNCDTVRKSLKWLQQNNIEFEFHDLKTETPSAPEIKQWLKDVDSKILVNRRGLTWRKLTDNEKSLLETDPIKLIQSHPTLLKRPLIYVGELWRVGFKSEEWDNLFT
ncbi:MAG: Spx/MgsR family RNA polymerase-binding regulatory protein [Enterobacterales bacterium]|nr:Spx/MgsR family RNA polymerase-binding regulatory protein [Enterobacterales bacterium]